MCVFLTPWTDDPRSEPAGGVFPRPIATGEVDVSTQEAHHTSLHVNADINQFKLFITLLFEYAGGRQFILYTENMQINTATRISPLRLHASASQS